MISKKICMVGSFAVGKTALVAQFVHSIFSDKYLSSVGVKISKKNIVVDGTELNLVLWDLEGQDAYSAVNSSYLRGSMGIFLVADFTRAETLGIALTLQKMVAGVVGFSVPQVLLINKADVIEHREITAEMLEALQQETNLPIIETSAKTGKNVTYAFETISRLMLG